ncbi:MAG TPA: acyltransferase domain-containing protein, partial [Actinophytocola sp.]|uniref:acyltransferase domain-containing protein n=1 Tax=Actinophytocola sp. TaxID=1872138 RepID=UPI002DDD1B0B
PDPADVCFSAGARRAPLPHRVAIAAPDRRTLIEALRRFANPDPLSPALAASGRADRRARVVFVFSGQGSQWFGMTRDLLATEPVFERAMRECDELIHAERGWSLVDRLRSETPLAGEQEIQPALWAIQVSLATLWRHWGIEPDLVIGHSMGEVAAATTAGALTPRDGAAVICRRSALPGTLPNPGEMVAVELGEREARAAIGDRADRVSVAVVNSDSTTVLAGDPDALAAVVGPLRERDVFCRQIRVNYAAHSPSVEPLRDALLAALAGVHPRPGAIPMHSTALDRVVSGDELDAAYWWTNFRAPVRFGSAVRAVLAEWAPTLFIEISPHPLLIAAIEDAIDLCGADSVAVPSLLREAPGGECLRSALGTAYVRGCVPDWARLYEGARFVPLPTYPWQHRKFWVRSEAPPTRVRPGERAGVRSLGSVRRSAAPPDPTPPPAGMSAKELAEDIARRLAEMLAVSADTIDATVPLCLTGMDSVLAARLRLRLKQDLGLHVMLADLLGDSSLLDVAENLLDDPARPEPARG